MPGKESGLGYAEQQTDDVEAEHAGHQRLRARDDAPGEHDAGDPAPRTEAVEQQIAGHFEEKIGDKEHAGRAAERGGRKAQILAHGGAGETDIHPVEIGDEIAEHQKRHDTAGDLAHRTLSISLFRDYGHGSSLVSRLPRVCSSGGTGVDAGISPSVHGPVDGPNHPTRITRYSASGRWVGDVLRGISTVGDIRAADTHDIVRCWLRLLGAAPPSPAPYGRESHSASRRRPAPASV